MSQMHEHIGVERDFGALGWSLRQFAERLGAATIGALHVHCSDEVEAECAEAFQRWFVGGVVPDYEPGRRAPMRTANLGARYEWGSAAILDQHFAIEASRQSSKLLVLKINSHAAVQIGPEGPEYGWSPRYGIEVPCCGALASAMAGSPGPSIHELVLTFSHDGFDRLDRLRDMRATRLEHRALLAAATNAQLQAQRAVADIRGRRPDTPTLFLVLPAVTINRQGPDSEILLGEYGIDWTEARPTIRYAGLGDDPTQFRLRHNERRQAILTDNRWPPP